MNSTAANERVWKFTQTCCRMQSGKSRENSTQQSGKQKVIPTLNRFPAARWDFCVWGSGLRSSRVILQRYDLTSIDGCYARSCGILMKKSVRNCRPIDEHATRIPKDSELLPCLYVPIAARGRTP